MNTVTWAVLTTVALVGIAAVTLMKVIDLVDFSDPERAGKAIAALIGAVGVIFTGVVGFIGVLVRQSIERRNLEVKEEADKRIALAEQESEQRLRLEAAIKAVELFKSVSGASPSEKAGALFAIVELEKLEFALRLLESLWASGEVETPGAVWVVNRALRAKAVQTQRLAAGLLLQNAELLPSSAGVVAWPVDHEARWETSIDQLARQDLFHALLLAHVSQDFDKLAEEQINCLTVVLNEVRKTDAYKPLRDGAILALSYLVKTMDPGDVLCPPGGPVRVDQIAEELSLEDLTLFVRTRRILEGRFKEWIEPHLGGRERPPQSLNGGTAPDSAA